MSKKIKYLSATATFIALCFVFTGYVMHIPTIGSNYIHLGDSIIYLAASILPFGFALWVGAIGASLADIATGVGIWAPFTLVIKALMVIGFSNKSEKIVTKRNMLFTISAGAICIVGYYIAESVLINNFVTPLATMPMTLIQVAANTVLYIIIGLALDKINFKSRIFK